METQAVGRVKCDSQLYTITAHMAHLKMKANYTFVPEYHVNDLYVEHRDDLSELVKQIYHSDWGTWSPRDSDRKFIQSLTVRHTGNEKVRVVLTLNSNEHKTIIVYRENNMRYTTPRIEAVVCCYMSDLDDDGDFKSKAFENDLFEHIEFMHN